MNFEEMYELLVKEYHNSRDRLDADLKRIEDDPVIGKMWLSPENAGVRRKKAVAILFIIKKGA